MTSSSHDGDSGRGDSDPDTHFSDVTNDCGELFNFNFQFTFTEKAWMQKQRIGCS